MSASVDLAVDLHARVQRALSEVRPGLQRDGGDISLIAIEGDIVRVRLTGACDGCPMAVATLVNFVEQRICWHAPEITRVVAE